MIKIKSILGLIFILLLNNCISNAQSDGISSDEIDKLVEKTISVFNVPGIAVGVIKDGKVIHSKGYGVRSMNSGQKINEHTLFGIASNSKAFTSASLGMLIDSGKLNWDDKVIKYIPEWLFSPPC